MRRTKASSISAEVVKFEFVGDVSKSHLICNAMDSLRNTFYTNLTVAFVMMCSVPKHTWIVVPFFGRIINEVFKTLFQIFDAGKLVSHLYALLRRKCQPHTVSSDAGLFSFYTSNLGESHARL